MKQIKILFLFLAVFAFSATVAAAKPVGIWYGNTWYRLGDLTIASIFNPQWHHDKPLSIKFTGKEFDKVSAIVYMHGANVFRFREIKADTAAKLEKFVAGGGTFIVLIDGGSYPGPKTGIMAKLLGANNYSAVTGKVEILDKSWAECGKIPDVYKHMLGPSYIDGKTKKTVTVKMAALTNLTTAKPIIGNKSGAIVAVNNFGKGKVYFINVRLTRSYTSYRQPYGNCANAAWEQYLPFAKKIHSLILEAKPALSKEKRELWDCKPLGPKPVKDTTPPREVKKLVSARKYTKLAGKDLVLVSGGKAQAVCILQRSGDKGGFAALNRVLEKMSGVKLPMSINRLTVEKDGVWQVRKNTFQTKIVFEKADHILIKASGNLITIAAPNTSLGIHTFMREVLGYRMLWPGELGEVFTKSTEIKTEPFELYDKSPILKRSFRNGLSCGRYPWKTPEGKVIKINSRPKMNQGCDVIGIDVREAVKARSANGSWFGPQRMGGSLKECGGTSFYHWSKEYGKTHPEFIALQFNTLRKSKSKHIRICKSNPDVIKTAVAEAVQALKNPRNKDAKFYRFSPSDGGYDIFCMCVNCRKWDPQGGTPRVGRVFLGRNRPVYPYVNLTDRILRFTCEADKELKRQMPEIRTVFLAYSSYQAPPEYYHEIPNDMLVTFVGGEYLHPGSRERDRKHWEYWSRKVKDLCWRPNFLGAGSGMPFNYTKLMAEDVKHLAATGMIGTDFDTLPHHWATQSLTYYVLANLLWDPSTPLEDLINDFCSKGFGSGAEDMKAYYDHCEKLTDKYRELGGISVKEFEDLTMVPNSGFGKFCRVFSPAEFKKLEGFLDAARQKVGKDSIERKRIDFVAAGLRFFKLNSEFALKYYNVKHYRERRKLIPEINKLIAEWKALFAKYPFAINVPALSLRYYYDFFRHCGWKPVRKFK